MERLRVSLLGLATMGVFAACTLIDPLDDITGGNGSLGKADAGKKDASSSGAGDDDDDDDDTTTSSGSTTSSGGTECTGPREVEPNESTATPLSSPLSCGVLTGGSGDLDRWSFKNDTGDSLQITLKIESSSLISFTLIAGSNTSTGTSGSTQVTNLAAGASLILQLTARVAVNTDIPYRINFTPS